VVVRYEVLVLYEVSLWDEDEDEGEEGLSDSFEAINLYFFFSSSYLSLVDWDVELVLPEQECPCLDLS
jgi:hypothetical protein